MHVHYQLFRCDEGDSWDDLLEEVAAFASSVGKDQLINISQSEDDDGPALTVWYWAEKTRRVERPD